VAVHAQWRFQTKFIRGPRLGQVGGVTEEKKDKRGIYLEHKQN